MLILIIAPLLFVGGAAHMREHRRTAAERDAGYQHAARVAAQSLSSFRTVVSLSIEALVVARYEAALQARGALQPAVLLNRSI